MLDSIFGTGFNQMQSSNTANQQTQMPSLTWEQLFALVTELRMAMSQMAASGQDLWHAVDARLEQDAKARRKERKCGTVATVVALKDRFSYVQIFDDQTKEVIDLTLNLIPDYQIYKIKFEGISNEADYFGIYFKTADFSIVDKESGFTGKRIRKAMVKNEVVFNAQIPIGKVENLLEDFFSAKIASTKNKITIPALSGWNIGIFMSRETFPYRKTEGIPLLPVHKKSLEINESADLCAKEYFSGLRQIVDWKHRLWLMLYPFGGILSSLLSENGIEWDYYLNIVMLEKIPINKFCKYLQVFNRKRLSIDEPTMEDVLVMKDDVLLLDARSDGMNSEYKQKEKRKRSRALAEKVVNGEIITCEGNSVCTPAVIFDDQLSGSKRAINLFADGEFFQESENTLRGKDVIGVVFSHFIEFNEKKYDELQADIKRVRVESPENAWLKLTYNECQKFWLSHGIEMEEMAGFPVKVNLDILLEDTLRFDDDIIEDCISIIRRGIKDWPIKEKRYGQDASGCILFTDDSILFPTNVLKDIMSRYGISSQMRKQFLVESRNQGYLKTDDRTSLSRQIQAGKNVVEMYQFYRNIFARPGFADIINLGKETEDV